VLPGHRNPVLLGLGLPVTGDDSSATWC